MSEETKSDFGELIKEMSEELKASEEKYEFDLKFPIEISGTEARGFGLRPGFMSSGKTGDWIMIRPCAPEHEKKTFLGIYLGDIAIDASVRLEKATGTLQIIGRGNPAIYVPDLKKVVFGYESWWGQINSPEDLKQISNQDIQDVWYVKAMKEMFKEDGQAEDSN